MLNYLNNKLSDFALILEKRLINSYSGRRFVAFQMEIVSCSSCSEIALDY